MLRRTLDWTHLAEITDKVSLKAGKFLTGRATARLSHTILLHGGSSSVARTFAEWCRSSPQLPVPTPQPPVPSSQSPALSSQSPAPSSQYPASSPEPPAPHAIRVQDSLWTPKGLGHPSRGTARGNGSTLRRTYRTLVPHRGPEMTLGLSALNLILH